MRKKMSFFYGSKIRKFMSLFVLCVALVFFSGCSEGEKENIKAQDNGKSAIQETERADAGEDKQAEQDEDMVSSPIDFEKLSTVSKEEESGVSYYNFHTTKEMPLPLNEWAKLDIVTEKGATVPAYIRFTSFTRDTGEIEKHMNRYFKTYDMETTFSSQPKINGDEYVLMIYDVTVGKDTSLEKGDYILPLSVRFPLQLYSTMRSGNFGDSATQERENLVMDVSVVDTEKPLNVGTIIEKAVLCSVPKDYTAYGIMLPYLNAGGTTQTLCFKLEY